MGLLIAIAAILLAWAITLFIAYAQGVADGRTRGLTERDFHELTEGHGFPLSRR